MHKSGGLVIDSAIAEFTTETIGIDRLVCLFLGGSGLFLLLLLLNKRFRLGSHLLNLLRFSC
jgi:hypothetical protein